MRSRLALAAVLVVAGVCSYVAAGAQPAQASVFSDAEAVVNSTGNWSSVWDYVGAMDPAETAVSDAIDNIVTTVGSEAESLATREAAAEALAAIDSAEIAAGSLPSEAAMLSATTGGAILLPAAALAAGYATGCVLMRIGSAVASRVVPECYGWPGSGGQSGPFSAVSGASISKVVTGQDGLFYCSTSGSGCGANPNTGVPFPSPGVIVEPQTYNYSTGAVGYITTGPDCNKWYTTGTPQVLACPTDPYYGAQYAAQLAGGGITDTTSGSCNVAIQTGSACVVDGRRAVNNVDMYAGGRPQALGSQTVAGSVTGSGGAQPDPGATSAKAGAVRQAIEASPGLTECIAAALSPGAVPQADICGTTTGTTSGTSSAFPIYLPQPLPGELYQDYLDRLAARTWTGAITTTDDPMSYPANSPAAQLAPGSVTSVTVSGTTVALYDPATGAPVPWPEPPPKVATATTPISVEKVPASWSGSGGVPAVTVPSLSASPCDKFPFGVFCWAETNVHTLLTAPTVCPNVSMTIPAQDAGAFGYSYHMAAYSFGWDFCTTTVFDGYIDTVRTVLAYLVWLGGIFYLGSRLLSIRGAPDTSGSGTELEG